jgi:hypothetical protein
MRSSADIEGNVGNIRKRPSPQPYPATTASRILTLLALALAAFLIAAPFHIALAETCTTQSGMAEPERNALADAAHTIALDVLANNAPDLRANSVAELQKDFGALQYMVAVTSPKLAGAAATVDQVYLLDATALKRNADGSAPDAQFFCSLNRSTMEADFVIPSLPPGKYGFAIVNLAGPPGSSQPAPWRLSLLLRQESGKWLLAGFYPKPMTAAGHDGLWYWTQARQFSKDKQPWNAWLYYQAAAMLLRPADFVLSSHLDKLRTEAAAAAPPALSEGISVDAPLVVKGADGAEYHFIGLTVDDSLNQPALDIAAHLRADPPPAPEANTDAKPGAKAPAPIDPHKRNTDAMSALLTAYPELRKPFHGVQIYAETPGQPPLSTELPMAEIK